MLTVATVQVSNYLGRGREYVTKFYDGIRKHLTGVEWRGVCFTDDPSTVPEGIEARAVPAGLAGWWNKLAVFAPDSFKPGERVLSSDLDVIPLGDLSDIAGYRGKLAVASDPFWPERMNSSLMAWEAGAVDHIWTTWDRGGRPQFDRRGDQFWIETMQPDADRWQRLFPGQVVSFKVDCWLQGKIPAGARMLIFHGSPRPHDVTAPFVKELWVPGWKLPPPVRLDWKKKRTA